MTPKRYIAHRGNLNGPNPDIENRPDYIQRAIKAGFDVEIDVWFVHGDWWLGHDEPAYAIDPDFLLDPRLWIHAKHPQALAALVDLRASLTPTGTQRYGHINFFAHDKDEAVLTSGGYVWTYPTKVPSMTNRTVIVMPENDYVEHQYLQRAAGACSDYIQNIFAFLPKLHPRVDAVEMVLKPKPSDFGLPQRTWAETIPPQRKVIYTVDKPKQDFRKLISEEVVKIVAEQMGVLEQSVNHNSHFVNDLNADSLDAVELLMEFEDHFEMSIADEEAEKMMTVGQIIDYIQKHARTESLANISKRRELVW